MVGFIVIVAIALEGIVAYFFYDVAKEKGYKRASAFVLPFLFGPLGMMYVIALPDRGKDGKKLKVSYMSENAVECPEKHDDLPTL